MQKLIELLKKLDDVLNKLYEEYQNRNMPPEQPAHLPTDALPRFQEFCNCIKNYEGANPANNNPYNERYYWAGYLPKYGVVKESPGGFAMFETLQIGELYGETCIRLMITNHPDWDFLDFFNIFAPAKDKNNPVLYAKTIASEMKVDVLTNLKTLFGL